MEYNDCVESLREERESCKHPMLRSLDEKEERTSEDVNMIGPDKLARVQQHRSFHTGGGEGSYDGCGRG